MTRIPTPPPAEIGRQQAIHALRAKRLELSKRLHASDFTDNKAASQLVEANAKIEALKWVREGGPDIADEPSLEDITERGLNWYWEPWEIEEEEDPDDEDQ